MASPPSSSLRLVIALGVLLVGLASAGIAWLRRDQPPEPDLLARVEPAQIEDLLARSGEVLAPGVGVLDHPDYIALPAERSPAWQGRVREAFLELYHPRPLRPELLRAKPLPDGGGRTAPPGVALEAFEVHASDGTRLEALFLLPEGAGAATPLVIAFHGHGDGLDALFQPHSYQRAIASGLAGAGYKVLAVETRSFGRSGYGELTHAAYTNRLRLQGQEFQGEALSDHRELLAWARARLAHAGPTAALGCSLGGASALQLALFDDGIDAVLACGVGGDLWTNVASTLACPCSTTPRLLSRMNVEHWLLASKARRVALELGRRDPLFGPKTAERLPERLGGIPGAPGLDLLVHDGGHEHDPPGILAWLAEVFAEGAPGG